jgi:hypothetical protein
METAEYKSDYFDWAEAQGEAKGEIKGNARALVQVITAPGIELAEGQLGQVASCQDLAQLDAWLDRALGATSADEVFKD